MKKYLLVAVAALGLAGAAQAELGAVHYCNALGQDAELTVANRHHMPEVWNMPHAEMYNYLAAKSPAIKRELDALIAKWERNCIN